MHLITAEQYCNARNITERHFRRLKSEGKINLIPGTQFVFSSITELAAMPDEDKEIYLTSKRKQWDAQLSNAHNLYKVNSKPTKETTKIIGAIQTEASYLKGLGFKTKGYDEKRPLQLKVKNGTIVRKSRVESKPIRNKAVEKAFPKALDLIAEINEQSSIPSINDAIDKAIYYAKSDENYYEVAGCENHIHTLRRHVYRAFENSGFKILHDFLHHHNKHRKKMAYVKGAFTDDIKFMDVFSLDDHKFDVAGTKVWNDTEGKFEQKQIWSWFVIEMKTMMPLAYEIKATPFTSEDIVRLLMRAFRQYGKPNWKVIMDNGLAASERVTEFLTRLEVGYEVQEAYSPTQKANNERIYKFIKEEEDNYQNDFVGSDHPNEGRHKSRKLSPEDTLQMLNESIKRYDTYVNGYFIDRPRKRDIKNLPDALLDKSKRVSIRRLYEYYSLEFKPQIPTDVQLRYAYMKYKTGVHFKANYLVFKKEVYIPEFKSADVNILFYEPSYSYTLYYDPMDLNRIDLYAEQDIVDFMTGEIILPQGKLAFSFESLATLEANEKKSRVAIHNKKYNKAITELAATFRDKYKLGKGIANAAIGDTGLIDLRKEQLKQVEDLIKTAMPVDEITIALDKSAKTNGNDTVDIEYGTSDEAIASLDAIDIE